MKTKIISLILFLFFLSAISISQTAIKSVKIGNQIWMTENLNVDRFKNGDLIPEVRTEKEWIAAGKESKPAWCYYENNQENGKKFGKLYNWYVVSDKRGLAPEGWHVPTKTELESLMAYVKKNGNALKAIGQGQDKGAGTNTTGFSALLAGYRFEKSIFYLLGFYTDFWSSTEGNTKNAFNLFLTYYGSDVSLYNNYKDYGFSVRCVKD